MIKIVFYIILIYFLIGAIAIYKINRKEGLGSAKEKWIKYFMYLIIVSVVVISIVFNYFILVASGILLIGLFEIIKVWKKTPEKNYRFILLALLFYLLIGFSFFNYALIKEKNELLFFYTLVFTFDGFAQITGQLIGKVKPFYKISPNKTLEGVLGGLLFCILTSLLLKEYLTFSLIKILILTVITAIVALAGDLAASYYKRLCRVKDYSSMIPGHGGVLDRFDSLLAVGAFYWLTTLI